MSYLKNIIPYEREIEFPSKIAEITSISLEHEEKISNQELVGDFILSGDYKVHNISVNKEEFSYRLPFNIELSDRVDKDSVNLDISDFTYDIKDDNTLTVKIELEFDYQEREKEEEIKEAEVDEITEEERIEPTEEELDEEINKLINIDRDNDEEKEVEKPSKVVLNTSNIEENTYVTYHVYIVEKDDTIESICQKYKVSQEILHEYNEFETISLGDKLLIPIYEDE